MLIRSLPRDNTRLVEVIRLPTQHTAVVGSQSDPREHDSRAHTCLLEWMLQDMHANCRGLGSVGRRLPLLSVPCWVLSFCPTFRSAGPVLSSADPQTHFCFSFMIASMLGRHFVHGRNPYSHFNKQ